MRDKHIHIPEDSKLLKDIYLQVDEELIIDHRSFIWQIWAKFIFYFSITILAYFLLYHATSPLYFVLCFIFYGFVSLLFAFNFSHDFSHNTIFKSKRLNNLCFILIYSLVGAHAEAWKQRHINSHHYAPNVAGYDSDLSITKLIRVIPDSEYFWFHKFQHLYAPLVYTTYSLFWVFIKDFVILFSKSQYNENKGMQYYLSFILQKIFYLTYILVMPILFSHQDWYFVLLGFFIMHFTQSLFLLFTFFMTHHVEQTEYPKVDQNGYIHSSWLMNQIKSSNDMHPFSRTMNFILGGFNNHIAHHLFPHIHHIHYPKLNRILYRILLENNIKPNQTSYCGGVVSHLKLLKRMSFPYKNNTF
ncbi:MAG: fatty acid desaturase [Saprospiraceae bacterium]|uniref:Fatty acid desaturase n=1 Tax=Candidatus Defluviibacterium haderslevense TaxID=2981993 RepID=A0A9D7S6B6_9BACT|nr:fatty acid desaturase [Candidatus Defluviibacterium haderslevense]